MKLKRFFAGLAVSVMVCAAAMSSAGAYFTDYDPATIEGTFGYSRTVSTTFTEYVNVREGKQLLITNVGDSEVSVRARVYCPSEYAQYVSFEMSKDGNQNWTQGSDGWYYYDHDLQPGEETTALSITITLPTEGIEAGDEIDVIAVYEAKLPEEAWDA